MKQERTRQGGSRCFLGVAAVNERAVGWWATAAPGHLVHMAGENKLEAEYPPGGGGQVCGFLLKLPYMRAMHAYGR